MEPDAVAYCDGRWLDSGTVAVRVVFMDGRAYRAVVRGSEYVEHGVQRLAPILAAVPPPPTINYQ